MNENRQFSTVVETRVDRNVSYTKQDPRNMAIVMRDRYIASTNYRLYNKSGELEAPSWTNAFQNSLIAHRMFNHYGVNNIVMKTGPYAFLYEPFETYYYPIRWINNLFVMRITVSNFLFTSSFLFLPFFTIIWLFVWLFDKNKFNAAILILTGTSLLNALAHLLASPIDRYLFLGYPLNLLVLLLLMAKLVEFLNNQIQEKKQRPSGIKFW
jgi:hypothetical protein